MRPDEAQHNSLHSESALHGRLKIGDDVITPSVSIGVAVGSPGRDNVADLLRRADGAVLTAKRAGGNQVAVSTDDISRSVVFRNDVKLHLQADIDSDALLLCTTCPRSIC